MKIRSVQGLGGGSGVTFLAQQLALAEQRLGRNVVVLDLNPDRCLHSQLTDDSFHYLGDVRELFSDRTRLDLTTRKTADQWHFQLCL